MALATTGVIEVRISGNDLNGAYFNVAGANAGIDYSQQNAPVLSLSDISCNNTATITSAAGGFTTAMVRNGIQINDALYEIVSFISSNSVTLDRTAGTISGASGRVGGALATPGRAGQFATGIAKIWIADGTYTLTTTTANVAGGPIQAAVLVEGYYLTRGNKSSAPVLKAGANSTTIVSGVSGTTARFINVRADGNGFTSVTGISATGRAAIIDCEAYNCNSGINGSAFRCYAYNCTTGFLGPTCAFCVANQCAASFNAPSCNNCIAVGASGSGFTIPNTSNNIITNCTAHNCVLGFTAFNTTARFFNCVATSNANRGFQLASSTPSISINNASWNNNANDIPVDVALTADPWTNSAATISKLADAFSAFAPNNTAGGGALLRGASGLGYADLGAVQHQDTGSGGSTAPGSIFGSSIICAEGRTN